MTLEDIILNSFFRLRIRPRILCGISDVDLSLSLYGEKINIPICMAPVGIQAMANPMAEKASAQGNNLVFIKLNAN